MDNYLNNNNMHLQETPQKALSNKTSSNSISVKIKINSESKLRDVFFKALLMKP